MKAWLQERARWLTQQGINPNNCHWRHHLQSLDQSRQDEFHSTVSSRWHDELDKCYGSCVLKDPTVSRIVADSFLKFDGEQYWLTDFVIMPNHAHLLVAFADDQTMLTQCEAWKRFTGRQINQLKNSAGRFWQQDGFDHLVRSLEQFRYLRHYIAENPKKACLKAGEYFLYSCDDVKKK
ncbi:MAG: transposase [Planctomycetaceae bacterium]